MMGFGLFEILIIAGIILLLVGGKRLPEVGSGLAKAIKGFKRTMKESREIDVTPSRDDEEDASASSRRKPGAASRL
jgi:sec-independent protein translocase protein TatA